METIRPDPRSLSLPIASLLHTNSTLVDRANRKTKQKKKGGKKIISPFRSRLDPRPNRWRLGLRRRAWGSRRRRPPPASAGPPSGPPSSTAVVRSPNSCRIPLPRLIRARGRGCSMSFFFVANSISALHCSFGSLEHAWSVDGSYTSQWQTWEFVARDAVVDSVPT